MTDPFGLGRTSSDQPFSIANWFVGPQANGADGGTVGDLQGRTQSAVTPILQAMIQASQGWGLASSLVYEGLRAGISLPLAIIEAIVNRLFGTNIDFNDLGTVLDAIEQVPGVSQMVDLIKQFTGVDLNTIFDGIDLTDPGAVLVAIEQAIQQAIVGAIQEIVDLVFNTLAGSAATQVPLTVLAQTLQALVLSIETATTSATVAFDAAQSLGALFHQAMEGLATVPFYAGPADFLGQLEGVVFALLGNVFQSLSPRNPSIASNNAQINAIWAAIAPSATHTGIRYVFDVTTSLSAIYTVGTNPTLPAWTAPTGFGLPTQVAVNGTTGVANDFVTTAAVFTGSTLMSDRFEASMVVEDVAATGTSSFFLAGHGTTGLTQHVSLEFEHEGFADSVHITTYPGGVQQANVSLGLNFVKVNDVLGIQYDGTLLGGGTNTWAMFLNGVQIGPSWPDTGALITHGVGYREVGVVCNLNNFQFAPGPILGLFVANDY